MPWDQIADIGSGTVDDDGEHLPVLWIRSVDPGVFPADAWGARLVDDRTIALLASDWEIGHVAAAEAISKLILDMRAREQPVDVPFDPDEIVP